MVVKDGINYISRPLSKQNIKMVGLPARKLSTFLQPITDDVALKTPGVYSIPWESIHWTHCAFN
jgi:hypothetical protein